MNGGQPVSCLAEGFTCDYTAFVGDGPEHTTAQVMAEKWKSQTHYMGTFQYTITRETMAGRHG
jgi:hypothetical protein